MSVRISLRGQRRLIWVDTLRRDHNVRFFVERLKCYGFTGNVRKKRRDMNDKFVESSVKTPYKTLKAQMHENLGLQSSASFPML